MTASRSSLRELNAYQMRVSFSLFQLHAYLDNSEQVIIAFESDDRQFGHHSRHDIARVWHAGLAEVLTHHLHQAQPQGLTHVPHATQLKPG